MIVYADTAFLFNFSMNVSALFLASFLMRLKPAPRRLASAAALGALYGTGVYLLPAWLYLFPFKALFGLLEAAVAFRPAHLRPLLRAWIFALLANTLLGGLAELIFAMGGGRAPDVPFWLVFGTALLATPAYAFWIRLRPPRAYIPLIITTAQGVFKFDALVDSGCLLREPTSLLPVAVLPRSAFPESEETPLRVPFQSPAASGEFPAFIPLYAAAGGREVSLCVALNEQGFQALVPACVVAKI